MDNHEGQAHHGDEADESIGVFVFEPEQKFWFIRTAAQVITLLRMPLLSLLHEEMITQLIFSTQERRGKQNSHLRAKIQDVPYNGKSCWPRSETKTNPSLPKNLVS